MLKDKCFPSKEHFDSLATVTSGLRAIVKTGITIVSYFGNVTASRFALTIVRKFTPLYPSEVHELVLSLQTNNQSECDNSFCTCDMSKYKYAE